MKKRQLLTLSFSICLVLVLGTISLMTACAKSAPAPAPVPAPAPAPPQTPIKIGVLVPLTGPVSVTGKMLVDGVKLGFEEAGYEVAGRKIELIIEDEGGIPEMAIDKARKLVEHDNVSMIIGPLITKLAVAPYMAKVMVPNFVIGPSPWEATKYDWTFSTSGTESEYAYTMGRYAYEEMGLRTINTITIETFGHSFLDAFIEAFEKSGGQVVSEQYTPFPCPDFSPYLTVMKDADAVVAWFHGSDSIAFLTQYHEFGIRQRMPLVAAFHGAFFHDFILDALPPEAAEAVIGERVPTDYTNLLETDLNKRFVAAFEKKYDYTPGEGEAMSYGSVQAALETLKATGGDTTPEKLRQAILALDFEDPGGHIRIDPATGMAIRDVYIVEIRKIEGKYVWVPVYTYEDVPPRGY